MTDINRREALKACMAVAGATGLIVSATQTQQRYGPVTEERHRALRSKGVHLHVFHQGQDVTTGCYFADDTGEGMAKRFLRNANGKYYLDPHTNRAVEESIYGVTIREGKPFA